MALQIPVPSGKTLREWTQWNDQVAFNLLPILLLHAKQAGEGGTKPPSHLSHTASFLCKHRLDLTNRNGQR